MDDAPDTIRQGLSPEARRNYVDTASLTPRDKENAGANSTRNSLSEAADQANKGSFAPTPRAPPSARTSSSRSLLVDQESDQQPASKFFPAASPPSPSPAGVGTSLQVDDTTFTQNQTQQQQVHQTPAATNQTSNVTLNAQKSPPGTSQVLRKHFQSLGFATPGKPTQQQRLLSSGAVRLATPNSHKKSSSKGNQTMLHRLGYDGTKYTPSKELLKSTASSRSQRIANLKDMSMEQAVMEGQEDFQIQRPLNQLDAPLESMNDDEASTVSSSVEDASFDISLPGMTHSYNTGPSLLLEPQSPMTPRMGCSDPVALTLLNDGKEDYHFLLAQDALCPVPKVENRDEAASRQKDSMFASPSSSSPSFCLTPTNRQSPAEVRGTLSQKDRSTLARPVAVMAKGGRISPPTTRLTMRPQPKHVR